MPGKTIAALDLGSNTFRLMLAEKNGGYWQNKRVFQHIPRLSERLTIGGKFAPEALKRGWEALDDFAGHIRGTDAATIMVGATMAARLAADGPEFMADISNKYGWETMILSGEEEAALTGIGTLTGLSPLPDEALIFDIGGRSTELISSKGLEITTSQSLSVGVIELTESYLSSPTRPGELEAVAAQVREALDKSKFSHLPPEVTLIGTAGTVTTVAALLLELKEFDPEQVNNARITSTAISNLLFTLADETMDERIKNHGLHPRRADAIVAGLVEVLEILKFFDRQELITSANGLLEGLWLKAAELL